MKVLSTKEKMLHHGKTLLQRHGYNGFSFQHIADELEIKKPSLYDHYSSKDELILAIVEDYKSDFKKWTEKNTQGSPLERIKKVFDIFHYFVSDKKRVCPILALAVDVQSLSKEIQSAVQDFTTTWLDWLEQQIKEGQKSGEIRTDIKSKSLAALVYSQAMGSQYQAKIRNMPELTLDSADFIDLILRNQ